MIIVSKVSDAIHYLYSKGFIQRDLDPGNLGLTDDNVVKLFDFGFTKSIRGDESIEAAIDSHKYYDENEIYE